MDKIYFFTEEFLLNNKQNIKQCNCSIPGCTLLLYTSPKLNHENIIFKENLINIDFKNRKKVLIDDK